MWTVGQEKKLQLELSVVDLSLQETIEYIWDNLLSEVERKENQNASPLTKLYILLKMAFLYGENTKRFEAICPHCKSTTEIVVDCSESLIFKDGELEVPLDLPLKEFKERESKLGTLAIDTHVKCLLCDKDIHVNMGIETLIKSYLFAYSVRDFLELVLFLKKFNFSIQELESLIPLELQTITQMIIDEQKRKEEAAKNVYN